MDAGFCQHDKRCYHQLLTKMFLDFLHSQYFLVFKDSFFACFFLTFGDELALPIMFYYENYNNIYATIMAYFGSVAGLMATYFICYGFAIILRKPLDNHNYKPFAYYYDKISPLFFSLLFISQANVIAPFFAGFLKMKGLKTLVLISIFRAMYYSVFFYNAEFFISRM